MLMGISIAYLVWRNKWYDR